MGYRAINPPVYPWQWTKLKDDMLVEDTETGEIYRYVLERMCKGESDLSEWVCSECQCWIPTGITPENKERVSAWNFCPHCGAKVVDE